MDHLAAVSEELAEIEGQIADIFRALSNGFQKLEKVKDVNRQSRQLEELTDKMRECKRLFKTLSMLEQRLLQFSRLRIVNELDSIHFSINKASKLVKELDRQVATDKCIMAMLFLVITGVIAIIIIKLVNPNKDIRHIPGLASPAMNRRLHWNPN